MKGARTAGVLFISIALIPALCSAGGVSAGEQAAKTTVIRNIRIVPVTSDDIPRGTIVIRDGLIESVGPDAVAPAGAEVIDGAGLIAYPGMIDAYSSLGLVEISGVQATVDNRETGRFNPQVRSLEALRYDSMHIPIARSNGITAALLAPTGGVISGQSCLIRLDGWTNREMAVKHPAALHIELPGIRGGRGGFQRPGAGQQAADTPKILEELAGLFKTARLYEKRLSAARADLRLSLPEFDETSTSLLPLLHGEMPAVISVHSDRDIKAVLAFVREQNIKAILYGAEQGWKVADEIAKAGLPVIIGSLYDLPPVFEDGYDSLYKNPGLLAAAGVRIAFSSSSASAAKDLPYHAAKAAAFGLDRKEALRAVTINTAKIFGVDGLLGSIEKGKSADIVLADDDIMEFRTNVKYVFIKGKKVDLSTRYSELLEKFEKRGK